MSGKDGTDRPLCRAGTGTGGRQKVSEDTFGDLLGSQGFNFTPRQEAGPRTINEMKKADMAREMDPDKLKVSCHWPLGFGSYRKNDDYGSQVSWSFHWSIQFSLLALCVQFCGSVFWRCVHGVAYHHAHTAMTRCHRTAHIRRGD